MANIVFFLGPGHPNWSREGSEGKFQSGQRTDSCVVWMGEGGEGVYWINRILKTSHPFPQTNT